MFAKKVGSLFLDLKHFYFVGVRIAWVCLKAISVIPHVLLWTGGGYKRNLLSQLHANNCSCDLIQPSLSHLLRVPLFKFGIKMTDFFRR